MCDKDIIPVSLFLYLPCAFLVNKNNQIIDTLQPILVF